MSVPYSSCLKSRTPVIALLAALGCASSDPASTSSGPTGGLQDVRGDRYCEVLVGYLDTDTVKIDVYNSYSLNDCPQDAWTALDTATIQADHMADIVVLNGPRYWVMDRFVHSQPVDPTPVPFGSLEMMLAGRLEVSLADAMGGQQSYAPRTVARTTSWVYDAGKPVYELVDPAGQIFDMQSYSVQKVQQTEASLADLGSVLAPPAGWAFRSRVLDAALTVTAVDGMATVVQDEHGNTYQLSQQ